MRKLFAVLVCIMMICVFVGSALASTHFEWYGNDTSTFYAWGPSQISTGSNWHITWEKGNMLPSLRAAVRIYAAPGEYASSTFVYSSQSFAYHPYNPGYGNGGANTYIAGRVDNRDSGTLDVSGTFHN